jgi:hypothetical protein
MKHREVYHGSINESLKTSQRRFLRDQLSTCRSVSPSNTDLIFFDSSDASTSQVFSQAGYDKHRLHVPNPFVAAELQQQKVCTVHPLLFSQFIEQRVRSLNRVGLVWMDYTCTFPGNSRMSPERDLCQLLSRVRLTPQAVLAITFCRRDRRGKKNQLEYVRRLVHRVISLTQYRHREIRCDVYSSMVFVCFKLTW